MNNPIWIMTSAFDQLTLDQVMEKAKDVGVQGLDVCVFRKDGTRDDFVATHLNYENFGCADAQALLEKFNQHQLRLSLGAFDNLIGGDPAQRVKNQNHLLRLIRMAHLLGGDSNDVLDGYNLVQNGSFETATVSRQASRSMFTAGPMRLLPLIAL